MPQPPDDSFNSQLNHLASQMISKHQTDRALILLKIVLKTDPKNFPALSNLGTIFKRKDNYTKALSFYRQAALIEPNNPEIHYNLGQTYLKIGKFKLALKHLLSCRQFGGNYPGLNLNIAVCYEEVGQIKLAQTQYKHLLAHQPNYLPALSNLARLAQYTWQWDLITQLTPQLNATLRQELRRPQPVFEKPYTNLLRSNNKTLNLAVAKNHSTALKTSVSTSYFHSPNSTPPHSPLKLGYLSCDYGDHVMAYHTHPLFSLHNRRQFQVYAYAYGPPNHSQLRSQIQHDSDVWQDFSNQSAHSIAEKIYRDGIDILIDLAGHTGNSRFDILAHRPAPIQVHYLGFPGSTGADYIDYLFTDKILTPLSYQKYFSEKLIFLPDCYQINVPEKYNPHRYTRTQMGLPENGVVFCSFNQSRKITPEIMTIWLKLLKNVPNAVLWLVKSNDLATSNICAFAATHHVNPNRLIFAPFIEFDQQLDRLSLADIALDPILYNGGATTSDALLAGIPVITKTGTRYVSRMSTSMLSCLGLTDCITTSLDDYYQVALELASNPEKLKNLKSKILKHKFSSPLFNPQLFVTHLESAYQTIWQRYMQGKPPQSFSVKRAS